MDRTRQLIEDVERELPGFVQTCKSTDTTVVVMSQDAFAPKLGMNELILLGKAIKYAGMMGKEVRVIPSTKEPS